MFIALVLNNALDILGIIYILTIAVKITLRKPVSRWFW